MFYDLYSMYIINNSKWNNNVWNYRYIHSMGGDVGIWLNVDYTLFSLPVYNLQANFLENLHLHFLHY